MSKRVAKLVAMSPDELRSRLLQLVMARTDNVRCRIGLPPRPRMLEVSGSPTRFFFTPAEIDGLIDCLRRRLPAVAAETVGRAERICDGHYELLGYRDLSFGRPPDWHLDPVSGKVAPRLPWYKVPYLDYERVGDAKVTWELNRHQHLVILAKAYRLTEDPRFAAEIDTQLASWWRENPYPNGINWASALEVAFRSISWVWVEALLSETAALPPATSATIRSALALNARHLERYLSTYFSPNTHLIGEAFGLFVIGSMLPQAAAASRWREIGWRVLVDEAERQVRADGFHFERSVYYHVYTLDFFLHARILAARNALPKHDALDAAIEGQLEVLRAMVHGDVPFTFGDDDGGRLFDGARNRARHLVDPLSTGAALYDRADLKLGEEPCEETLWLLGLDGIERFDDLAPAAADPGSKAFPASGIYVASGAEPTTYDVLVAAGPFGEPRGGHGHADLLSVQVGVGGAVLLGDSGTLAYVADDDTRDRFRRTRAHNVVEVDGRSQAEPAGPFSWNALPDAPTELWIGDESFDLFRGSHCGYGNTVHTRWVFHLRSRFVIVHDRIQSDSPDGAEAVVAELRWHLEPGVGARPRGAGFDIETADDVARMAMLLAPQEGWVASVDVGTASPAYGLEVGRSVLRFAADGKLPLEITTALIPLEGTAAAVGEMERSPDHGDRPLGASRYEYRTDGAAHRLFFPSREGAWQESDWESDASFLYCKLDRRSRRITQLIAVGGRQVRRGEQVWEAPPEPGGSWGWADAATDPSR